MKKTFFALMLSIGFANAQAQYNNMWIPDTLSGTTFNMNIKDTLKQIVSKGQQTITGGINGNLYC